MPITSFSTSGLLVFRLLDLPCYSFYDVLAILVLIQNTGVRIVVSGMS